MATIQRTSGGVASGMTISGVQELRAALLQAGTNAVRAGAKALYQEAETIMTAAKEITPVDTGALRASGHVEPPKIDQASGKVSLEMGFGGTAAPYALIVHEDLDAKHPVGQAKYLEVPVVAAAAGFESRLAASIRAELGL